MGIFSIFVINTVHYQPNNGFESIPRTRFVRIFSRFQRVSISSFRPAVKPKPFDR
ncbi:TPA: erythromycin resistance leader peptide [Enterococcus faecium]